MALRVEAVPFARHRAGFTWDFEDLAACLAAKMDKTAITRLLRIDWDTVGRICERVVDAIQAHPAWTSGTTRNEARLIRAAPGLSAKPAPKARTRGTRRRPRGGVEDRRWPVGRVHDAMVSASVVRRASTHGGALLSVCDNKCSERKGQGHGARRLARRARPVRRRR